MTAPKVLTWDDYLGALRQLAEKITAQNFHPDMLVAVARGGWIPTRFLSDLLKVKKIASIGMAYQDASRQKLITYSFPDPIQAGQRILLIEDCLESGKSLIAASDQLRAEGAKLKTAALYYTSHSHIVPDFSLGSVLAVPKFPWEQ
ncbi:MAG: phosphoribosyltransferase [Dongiaceae bacterium]